MNILAISIQQNYQDNQTIIWFGVDGAIYGVSDTAGEIKLLDCDGYPVDECNDHDGILDDLMPHYESLTVEYAGEDCEIREWVEHL